MTLLITTCPARRGMGTDQAAADLHASHVQ
jgi:hypothetical protein